MADGTPACEAHRAPGSRFPPSVRPSLGLGGKLPQAPPSAPSEGPSAGLAWAPSACGLDATHPAGAGPRGKVSGGRGQEHPGSRSGEKWKVKYLESHRGRRGGKCVGMFPKGLDDEQAFPPPTPTPRRRARGVCRNRGGGGCCWPEARGAGHFQGQSWGSREDALGEAPDPPGPGAPRLPGRAAAASAAGAEDPTIQIVPPGVQKALPARVTWFGSGIQALPSDPLSGGLGRGEPAAAEAAICALGTCASSAPRWPRRSHAQDARGRKFDSTDQASVRPVPLPSPSLLPRCSLRRLGFRAELVWSPLSRSVAREGTAPGREDAVSRPPARPPARERPFQDPAGWRGSTSWRGSQKQGLR